MWDCVGCLFEKKRLLGKTLLRLALGKTKMKESSLITRHLTRLVHVVVVPSTSPTSQTKPLVHAPCPNLRVELSV